jgi:hypothetical protein
MHEEKQAKVAYEQDVFILFATWSDVLDVFTV